MTSTTPQTPPASPSAKSKHGRRWWGGLVLIVLGGAFLAQGMGFSVLPQNWWAGFILLAALSSFWRAWVTFKDENRVTPAVKGQVMGGLNAGAVAVIFLFGLDWAKAWPIF